MLNVKVGGTVRPLDVAELAGQIQAACAGLGSAVDAEQVLKLTLKDLYDGVAVEEVRKCSILSARTLIEHDPAYSFVTARLLLNNIFCEILGEEVLQADMAARYVEYFPKYIKHGIEAELLNEELGHFDLAASGARRWMPAATCNSIISVCRLCMTVTSCIWTTSASNCRRHSSCAWRWA